MQKRIKELATQAGISLSAAQFSGVLEAEVDEFNLEKFAELTIQDCLDVITNEVSHKYKNGSTNSSETEDFMGGHYAGSLLSKVKIRQHFGIKYDNTTI